MEELNQVLQHYGVLGMKWGVRKDRSKPGKANGKVRSGKVKSKSDRSSIGQKIKDRTSKHEQRYLDKGVPPKEAAIMAKRRRNAEIAIAAVATTAIVAGGLHGSKVIGREFIDKTIKPNTTIQTLTNTESRDFSKPFYAAYNKKDLKRYEGVFGTIHLGGQNPQKAVYKNIIKSPESIKIASHKNARKALEEVLSDKSPGADVLRDTFKRVTGSDSVNIRSYQKFNRKIVEIHSKDFRNGTNSLGPFYNKLKEKGYNGLLDINDQKFSGYNAKNPSIIFDKGKKAIESVSKISPERLKSVKRREVGKLAGEQIVQAFGPMTVAGAGVLSANSLTDVESQAIWYENQSKK